MTGHSANYLLGKRLLCALKAKGDVGKLRIVFASVALRDVLGADRSTTAAVHWYSGAARPVLLYYRMHRLCDKVDEACIFVPVPGQSPDDGSSGGRKRGRVRT